MSKGVGRTSSRVMKKFAESLDIAIGRQRERERERDGGKYFPPTPHCNFGFLEMSTEN